MGKSNRYAEVVSFGAYLPEKKVQTTAFASPSDLPRSLDFVRLTGILSHHEVSEHQGSFRLFKECFKEIQREDEAKIRNWRAECIFREKHQ